LNINKIASKNLKQGKEEREMTDERKNTMRTGTKIGAALGAIVFLVFGLVPGFYFGSYGTLVLLSTLAGGPVEPTTIVRMLTVVGIVLGIFCVGAVSIVLGSVFGTSLGYVVDVVGSLGKVKKAEEAKIRS
jgi:hypothetical protein